MTLREAVYEAAAALGKKEELRVNAGRDAELLLLDTLGLGRTALYTEAGRVLSDAERSGFEGKIARRLLGEPVQYITGVQEFYGLAMRVTPAVLIPRPETELLVEAALERLPGTARVLDVGTGSGAIAIAVAVHRPEAAVTALDVSEAALAVARENAARHGARVRFVASDLLAGVAGERFDAVLSNPPYVPEGDRATLAEQVREFEPAGALFAGSDGMAVYRRLIPQAEAALEAGGLLTMEFGYGQREAMAGLLEGWDGVEFLRDLQGIDRVVVARRR